MARERMVTRTVELSVATYMVLNVRTAEVQLIDVPISGAMTNDEAMKYARKHLDTSDLKYATCTQINTKEVLYGMPEAEFIRLAKVLPPR